MHGTRTLVLVATLLLAIPVPARSESVTADGVWSLLPFPPPSARTEHSAIYDPVRNRMIVFGGSSATHMNDVWALTLSGTPTWVLLTPTGTPPSPRRAHTAVYDPVRDRMLVYAGDDGSSLGDVWALSLAGTPAWSSLAPTGSPPPVRSAHTAVYDPVRDRMVIYAGKDGATLRDDVWALTLSGTPSWSSLSPSGGPPSGRSSHTAIYDSVRDRMVVFGGSGAAGLLGDLWALTFAGSGAWSTPNPSGTPPPPRMGHTALYDAPRDRMVLHGGNDGEVTPSASTWSLPFSNPSQWSLLAPGGSPPIGRFDHTSVFDSAANRMLVFGGFTETATNVLSALTLTGSPSWSMLSPAGGPAPPRTGHAAVFDPPRDRMLVIMGENGAALSDIWALNMAAGSWVQIQPSGGAAPEARDGHVAIYDPVRDRVILFGGLGNDYKNDTWALSLGPTPSWSQIATSGGPPPARYASAGVYDPIGDRLVVFGGYQDGPLGDTWALSLSGPPAWTQLASGGPSPPARFHHGAVRSPTTGAMLIFGGTSGTFFNDVWALSLSGTPSWAQVTPSGTPPSPRYESSMVVDSGRARAIVFGGYDGTFQYDAWALDLAGSPSWSSLAPGGLPSTGRQGHSAIFDRFRDRMLVYGGLDGANRDDTWSLTFGSPTGIVQGPDPSAPAAPRLHAAFPNPVRALATIGFELPSSRPGRLSVYDVRGRLVRVLRSGVLPAGPQLVRWDGRDEEGRRAASGTYFYRLETEGAPPGRKLVLAR